MSWVEKNRGGGETIIRDSRVVDFKPLNFINEFLVKNQKTYWTNQTLALQVSRHVFQDLIADMSIKI